uniref:LRRNT domain-containing protein n=1 Tax=Branchiostoma floridae TaxID=7739 RepID=C3ZJ83_BRAFL|eukprot:XP_002591403.1 hypothetical protein BRAFLDRAFT_69966 [Branchiostoma floridae]
MPSKARRMLVLLLIILKEAGPTAACSSSCSSDCDCSSRGLTGVPQDLPTTITILNLENNTIANLSQSDFSRLHPSMSTKARRLLVFLLIILKEAGPTAACSSSCSSDCDCSSRGLTSVPQDLPTDITRLNLNNNAISESGDADGDTVGGDDTWTDEIEYDDVLSSSQRPQLGSEQMQHHDHYEVPSPSLCPENGAHSQAKEVPQFQSVLPPLFTPEARSESADAAARKVGGGDTRTDEEYNDVLSPSQRPHPGSGQTQHLSSFSDDYEVPSPTLGPENGAHPQARAGQQPHEYENTEVIAAADKDSEAGSQVIENENDDDSVFNRSQTAAAPGADSPNHYEPLRNPSDQQQQHYTPLLPHNMQY